ncbi:DoxX family protein [Kumtagia ephedrae]|jgi:putative oxidoreductase|uniref:DoxX family protein n=1 Tax=Kumtagia ephedrae TaxID=2116701 RepID=A0A2P7SQT8_9HYPH|nr:DoxX family protein [Mesorhizobium ephedrae]PSJ64833.1 DoxX family protein [Mesorhizobium ephedrae]
MESDMTTALVVIGRILLGGAFVFAGIRNVMNASLVGGLMEARGVPMAGTALYAGIVLQIVAGVLFAAGILVPYAAAALIVFLIAATPMFHNFWDVAGPDRAAKINGWVSNVALAGGLLIAAV